MTTLIMEEEYKKKDWHAYSKLINTEIYNYFSLWNKYTRNEYFLHLLHTQNRTNNKKKKYIQQNTSLCKQNTMLKRIHYRRKDTNIP